MAERRGEYFKDFKLLKVNTMNKEQLRQRIDFILNTNLDKPILSQMIAGLCYEFSIDLSLKNEFDNETILSLKETLAAFIGTLNQFGNIDNVRDEGLVQDTIDLLNNL